MSDKELSLGEFKKDIREVENIIQRELQAICTHYGVTFGDLSVSYSNSHEIGKKDSECWINDVKLKLTI